MAAVYIHQLPFFSTPHLYTVSRGSWERMRAEMTWIMNNYYLKAKKESFLFCSKTRTKMVMLGPETRNIFTQKNLTTAVWINVSDGMVLMAWMISISHRMALGSIVFIISTETLCGIVDVKKTKNKAWSIDSYEKLPLWVTWKHVGAPEPGGFPARLAGGLVVSSRLHMQVAGHQTSKQEWFIVYMNKKYWEYCRATYLLLYRGKEEAKAGLFKAAIINNFGWKAKKQGEWVMKLHHWSVECMSFPIGRYSFKMNESLTPLLIIWSTSSIHMRLLLLLLNPVAVDGLRADCWWLEQKRN